MKFELRPPGKQYSDSELLDDIKRVGHLLNKSNLKLDEYKLNGGKHSPHTFCDHLVVGLRLSPELDFSTHREVCPQLRMNSLLSFAVYPNNSVNFQ